MKKCGICDKQVNLYNKCRVFCWKLSANQNPFLDLGSYDPLLFPGLPYAECDPMQYVKLCRLWPCRMWFHCAYLKSTTPGALYNPLYIDLVCETVRSSECHQMQSKTKFRVWPNVKCDQMQSMTKGRVWPHAVGWVIHIFWLAPTDNNATFVAHLIRLCKLYSSSWDVRCGRVWQ